jgi:two-component system, response regulator YesN
MTRILLIEDDYDLARSILLGIDLLEICELTKEVQYEGLRALVRVQSLPPPDLLILDMHLPNLAGQDIYETVRKEIPACKIIIVTANVRLVKEIFAKQGDWQILSPPDKVFTKPFSLAEFLEAVKKLVPNRM